jgi:hypothetical protein
MWINLATALSGHFASGCPADASGALVEPVIVDLAPLGEADLGQMPTNSWNSKQEIIDGKVTRLTDLGTSETSKPVSRLWREVQEIR